MIKIVFQKQAHILYEAKPRGLHSLPLELLLSLELFLPLELLLPLELMLPLELSCNWNFGCHWILVAIGTFVVIGTFNTKIWNCSNYESIMNPFWTHFEPILNPFRTHYEPIMGPSSLCNFKAICRIKKLVDTWTSPTTNKLLEPSRQARG